MSSLLPWRRGLFVVAASPPPPPPPLLLLRRGVFRFELFGRREAGNGAREVLSLLARSQPRRGTLTAGGGGGGGCPSPDRPLGYRKGGPGMRNTNKEPRGPPNRYAPCDWYYHVPLKRSEELVNSEVPQQPTSQVPGLGDFGDPHNEITFGGRRKWIKDTDSEYVKLAKQGGRPDLLRHFTPTPRKVSLGSYGAPEWYSHHSKLAAADESKPRVSTMPDYMIHEDLKTDQPPIYEPKRGPFDFDMKSVWQRDAEDKENKDKREENGVQGESSPSSTKEEIKLPAITPRYPHRTPQPVAAKEFHGGNRLYFPPMPAHKKNEPVNFSKLISSGYGDEWLQQRDDWEKKSSQPNDSLPPPNSETSQPESTQTDNE